MQTQASPSVLRDQRIYAMVVAYMKRHDSSLNAFEAVREGWELPLLSTSSTSQKFRRK